MATRIRTRGTLPTVGAIVDKLGLDKHGRVQRFLTSEVHRRMIKYMPYLTGTTASKLTRVISDTEIETAAPYARKLYTGKGIKHYTKTWHPLAGSHWAERMAQAEGDAIAADVQKLVDMERGGQ